MLGRTRLGLIGVGCLTLGIAYACGGDNESFTGGGNEGGAGGAAGASATGGVAGTGGTAATGGTTTAGAAGQPEAGGAAGAAGEPSTAGAAGAAGAAAASGVGGELVTAGAAGMAGMAGMAGAGGVPCSNADEDNDGQSECAGDCDDQDPLNWLGNNEICGDGEDNNCDGNADETALCADLGTFVSELTGDDTNPGTMLLPVQTIGQGMANAQTIMAAAGGSVDVFVAQGTYAEKVVMVQGVNLLGGYSCDVQPCSWARDPSAYVAEITNIDLEGVLADASISRETRIDGFTITGMAGNGTVGLTLDAGSPTVTNNVVTGGDAANGGTSVAIRLLAPTNDVQGALIDSNTITGGPAAGNSAGILMDTHQNQWVLSTYAVITRNEINGGTGGNAYGILAWSSGSGTLVRNNDIFGGHANTDGGVAWGIVCGRDMTIDANRINADGANPSTCGLAEYCGGIFSQAMSAAVTNNVVFGAESRFSAAVYLTDIEGSVDTVSLNSNYLDGAGDSADGQSVSMALGLRRYNASSVYVVVGRVINNILNGGLGTTRYGIYVFERTSGRYVYPEALRNNDFYIDGYDPTSPGNHAYFLLWDGSVTHAITQITDINALYANGLMPMLTSGNIDGDVCVDATFHLASGATCEDAGIATEAPPRDFEGDARPQGDAHDIGPDEVAVAPTP